MTSQETYITTDKHTHHIKLNRHGVNPKEEAYEILACGLRGPGPRLPQAFQ